MSFRSHPFVAYTIEVTPVYVPAYRPDHTYSIVVDLGTDVPSQVHFGVSDGIFSDNSGAYTITIYQLEPALPVGIDIKPGSWPNAINLDSKGVIPVAVLSSEDFDAATVDPSTVLLGGVDVAVRGKGNKLMAHIEDVDGDGLIDLVVQVDTEAASLWTSGTVILTATTYDNQDIIGSDEVVIVPPEE